MHEVVSFLIPVVCKSVMTLYHLMCWLESITLYTSVCVQIWIIQWLKRPFVKVRTHKLMALSMLTRPGGCIYLQEVNAW